MLEATQIQENKEKFSTGITNINRVGMKDLLNYLDEETNFFLSPASSNYHGNYDGGLCEHSLEVFHNIKLVSQIYNDYYSMETLGLIALLHDVCKINIYQKETKSRKVKDKEGNFVYDFRGKVKWEDYETYAIVDNLPLGHGEKSVIILQDFIKLTLEEKLAIRWHMGGYDDLTKTYIGNITANKAFSEHSIVTLLHMADLASIFLKPKNNEEKLTPEQLAFVIHETPEDFERDMF